MYLADSIKENLLEHVGETVTIFTTSGGESGKGFTGVLLNVSVCFVRLITCIGPAPGCALGNGCEDNHRCCNKNGDNGGRNNVGSVVDIPIDRIAAVVYNAL